MNATSLHGSPAGQRKGSHFLAFPGLAAVMTCYKRLAKIAT
ncbi:hypothetical protein FB387_006776 [Streptomyces cinereoruber]|nr:hypothetical protein [Streptomyces cinereoruber]NIH65541.1 hypothetical protein [Streptomyces cinereoruber]